MAAELADDVPDDLFPFPSPSASPLQILPHSLDNGGYIGPRHQETKGLNKEDVPSMIPSCAAPRGTYAIRASASCTAAEATAAYSDPSPRIKKI